CSISFNIGRLLISFLMRTPPFLFSGEKLLYQRRESSSYFLEIEGIFQLCPRKYFTHTKSQIVLWSRAFHRCQSQKSRTAVFFVRYSCGLTSWTQSIDFKLVVFNLIVFQNISQFVHWAQIYGLCFSTVIAN